MTSGKAKAAAKQVKQGTHTTGQRKVRTNIHFRRPKTLRLPRNPRYARKAVTSGPRLDKHSIIKHPLCTESSMKQIEEHNTLTFIVDLKSTKRSITEAVKSLYQVEILKVNTLIRPDGTKKAYVRLSPNNYALDVASKIGII